MNLSKDGKVIATGVPALLGCLLILLLLAAFYVAIAAVFTVLYNAVVPGIFGVGPVLDIGQGIVVVLLLSLVAGFFKR